MVVHCYDSNAMLILPIKNITINELTSALEDVFDHLEERSFKHKLYAMDNEAAVTAIKMIKIQNINLQLARPDLCRRITAKR